MVNPAQGTTQVLKEFLPDRAPPPSETGITGWLKKNLFSNWWNSFLTLASILLIALVLFTFLPWALRYAWEASSLRECREFIAFRYGEGVDGACWAVIRARFFQLIHGFYPNTLYWRQYLALFLLFVALAPILFTQLPRIWLLFSVVYPFLGFWLIWGGSVWGPITLFASFVFLGIVMVYFTPRWGGIATFVLAAALAALLWFPLLGRLISLLPVVPETNLPSGVGWISGLLEGLLPLGIEAVDDDRQYGGFMLAAIIGFTGIVASLPIGILLALGRQSRLPFIKGICVTFIEFMRGVPLITLLFVASTLLNLFLPPGTYFSLILRVIIMVTLFAAAYIAEVVRGGLAALPKGQYEAADALGLDYWKSMRLIILPQALKVSIPGIVSTFIGLFKDTTLVSIIGLLDPVGLSNAIRATVEWQGIVWELYLFIAFMFFIFCFSMSRYSMYLEKRLKTDYA